MYIYIFYIDISERMAGKQDGPSLIIYGPSKHPPPRIAKNAICFHIGGGGVIYEKLVVILFPCYELVCYVIGSYCPENLVTLGLT